MTAGMRLPDFIIIGAMKSGTSSLYQWLAEQPELTLPVVKEPHFFSRPEAWKRGLNWYGSLFAEDRRQLVGEASTTYTNPDHAAVAAARMAAAVPDVRLIYVLRHPLERLRSHYRHLVVHGASRAPFLDLLADPEGPLVRRSQYFTCLAPYTEAFPREQICVVRFEDLVGDQPEAWPVVLRHLGLGPRPLSNRAHNVSAEKGHFTSLMYRLWTSPLRRHIQHVPRPVRQVGRVLLTRGGPGPDARLEESSEAPIPEEVASSIWQDIDRLERWLGVRDPLWERDLEPERG